MVCCCVADCFTQTYLKFRHTSLFLCALLKDPACNIPGFSACSQRLCKCGKNRVDVTRVEDTHKWRKIVTRDFYATDTGASRSFVLVYTDSYRFIKTNKFLPYCAANWGGFLNCFKTEALAVRTFNFPNSVYHCVAFSILEMSGKKGETKCVQESFSETRSMTNLCSIDNFFLHVSRYPFTRVYPNRLQ